MDTIVIDMNELDVVVARNLQAGPLTAVKGTLLQSSIDELTALGYYDKYAALMGEDRLAELTGYHSGQWVPLDAMRAHYQACDRLHLTPQQLAEMGSRVGGRLQGPLLSALTSTMRMAGFNPWSAVPPLFRMAGRVFQGSSVLVLKLGPKELQATIFGNALCDDYIYFRVAFCGVLSGVFRFVGARSPRARVTHVSQPRSEVMVRMSWV